MTQLNQKFSNEDTLADETLSMYLASPDYPTELLVSAALLVREAEASRNSAPTDGGNIPTLPERSFSRAAVFTAFNCIESLWMDMVQTRLASQTIEPSIRDEIEKAIKKREAGIGRTIKKWPTKLSVENVTAHPDFIGFDELVKLRNQLAHPKLETYGDYTTRTLDELLRAVDAPKGKWAVEQASKMAVVLYKAFSRPVPNEIVNPWS